MVNKITNQKSFISTTNDTKFISNKTEIFEGIDSEVNEWINKQSKNYEEFEVKDIKQQITPMLASTDPMYQYVISIVTTVIYTHIGKKADM